MRSTTRLALCALAAALSLSAAEARLAADAYLTTASPTVNFGANNSLRVDLGSRAFLHFDLSTLPAGTASAHIAKATLRLYVNKLTTPGAASAAWSEPALTSANAPSAGPVVATFPVARDQDFVTVDVTLTVKAWLAAASNFGLVLWSPTQGVSAAFDSKEATNSSHEPSLQLTLAGPQGPPPSIPSSSPLRNGTSSPPAHASTTPK